MIKKLIFASAMIVSYAASACPDQHAKVCVVPSPWGCQQHACVPIGIDDPGSGPLSNELTNDFKVQEFFKAKHFPLQGAELQHWISHANNLNKWDAWVVDATKNIIQRNYWQYGLDIKGPDLEHWYAHYVNVDFDSWLYDQRNDVVRRVFGACGHAMEGNDLRHWYQTLANTKAPEFLNLVRKDWRCAK